MRDRHKLLLMLLRWHFCRMTTHYILLLLLNPWRCIFLLIMALLMLSLLCLVLLTIFWNSHKVVDYVEVIIDHVTTRHDVLIIKQSRVVDVTRWVSLLESTTTCCLGISTNQTTLWLLSVAFFFRVTEVTTKLRLVLRCHILLSLNMSWITWISTLSSLWSLHLHLLLLIFLLNVWDSFLRLFALNSFLLLVTIWLWWMWTNLD